MMWLLAAALASPLDDALTAYDDGNYSAAIEMLEPIEAPGPVVLYNLGAAYYRSGDVPRAIGAWRQAARYRPRDQDLAHSLAIARGDLEIDPPAPVDPAPVWLAFLTPGELGVVGLLFTGFASGLAVFARRQQRAVWGAVLTFVVGILITAVAVLGIRTAAYEPVVVVVDQSAVVRSAPDANANQRFTLPPGTEVHVTGAQAGFLRVETGDDRRGWLPTGAVWTHGIPSPATEAL